MEEENIFQMLETSKKEKYFLSSQSKENFFVYLLCLYTNLKKMPSQIGDLISKFASSVMKLDVINDQNYYAHGRSKFHFPSAFIKKENFKFFLSVKVNSSKFNSKEIKTFTKIKYKQDKEKPKGMQYFL